MNYLRECVHKEIVISRFIVRDKISGLEFAFCGRCWKRKQRLKGFELVEFSHRKLETKAEQARQLKKVPF